MDGWMDGWMDTSIHRWERLNMLPRERKNEKEKMKIKIKIKRIKE